MGSFFKKPVVGYEYYLSMLMGLSCGPVDAVRTITVGDQTLYNKDIHDQDVLNIDESGLFGGHAGEGGVKGKLYALFGAASQVVPDFIRNIIAPNSDIPDFKGVATIFFDGMVCGVNPYPKQWKFRIVRRLAGWDGDVWEPDLCGIDLPSSMLVKKTMTDEDRLYYQKHNIPESEFYKDGDYSLVTDNIHAMNGAHIAYQMITDRYFGRGFSRDLIGPTFKETAKTLFSEKFGVCISWDANTTAWGDVMSELMNTIGAVFYIDKLSGLFALKLIRYDYTPDDLTLFDRNSGLIDVEEDQSTASGIEHNEQIVRFHSPISNDDRMVRAQNLGSMQALGRKNSTTSDYQYIPTTELAQVVAQRDLRIQGGGIRKFTLKFDRRAWMLVPAVVFKISLPSRGIDSMVLRAGEVIDSTATDGTITVTATTDVYGLNHNPNAAVVIPTFDPSSNYPVPTTTRLITEVSYRDLYKFMSSDDVKNVSDSSTSIACYAAQPSGTMRGFYLQTSTDGVKWDTDADNCTFSTVATLISGISETTTAININMGPDMGGVSVGSAIQVGSEIMRIDAINGITFQVSRGCCDTLPAKHETNAIVFFTDAGGGLDSTEYGSGETITARYITNSLSSSSMPEISPTESILLSNRHARPYPAANIKINGANVFGQASVKGDLNINWCGRNKLISQDVLVPYFDGNQPTEDGVQTIIQLWQGDNKKVEHATSDNSWSYPAIQQAIDFGIGQRQLTLKVFTSQSKSGNILTSWQSYSCSISLEI